MELKNNLLKNKKGFMFTLDALLASLILVGGLLLISQHLLEEAPNQHLEYLSTDVLSSLAELRMSDLEITNNSFVNNLTELSNNTDLNLSVLEQIGTYWAVGQPELATNLSNYVLNNLLPANMGVNLTIQGLSYGFASDNVDVLLDKSFSQAGTPSSVVVGERMITGINKGSPLTGSTSSAYLRRIQNKTTNSFAYFGGFIGQGRITVRLDNLPPDINDSGSVREMFLEGEFDSDFDLLINNHHCTHINVNGLAVQRFNVTSCSSNLTAGNNTVTLDFTEGLINASVSGGLLGIRYMTEEFGTMESSGVKRIYLPDIDGVINLYDGFMVPGTLQIMDIYLHYWVDDNVTLPIFIDIGNTSVYQENSTGEKTIFRDDATLRSFGLNYNNMSNTTVPLRIGFYSGNLTNSTGNVTDVFLITSNQGSMDKLPYDIINTSSTNMSRIAAAKIVDHLFVDIVLNATGNRVGLVAYGQAGASAPAVEELSTDGSISGPLHTEINEYKIHSDDQAQRDLCAAILQAKIRLNSQTGRKLAIVFMTDGDIQKPLPAQTSLCDGSKSKDRATIWADTVSQACDPAKNPKNITFYAVGFGRTVMNDPAIRGNLSKMAECTGGKFANSTNTSELEDIYSEFATELAASSIVYTFQRATSVKDAASRLYGDSYIDISYEPPSPAAQQNQIPITFQTDQFNNCTPTRNIPEGLTITEAHIVSYSGDYWTKYLSVDGNPPVYDLSLYGANFTNLGDPFQLLVPPHLLTSGDHTFSIKLGANSTSDILFCSNDSLIYTGLVDASTNRSTVLQNASGCNWTVESEDNQFQDLSVPVDYNGTKKCTYNSTNFTLESGAYYPDDAYDVAAYNLLSQLDLDSDGRVSVNFAEEDLEILITLVSNVPYLWGPSIIRANVWQ